MDWKDASWVRVPSLRVSRQGLVIPLLDCLLFTTLAVTKNCLIWSFVNLGVESSAAAAKPANSKQTMPVIRARRYTSNLGIWHLAVMFFDPDLIARSQGAARGCFTFGICHPDCDIIHLQTASVRVAALPPAPFLAIERPHAGGTDPIPVPES